MPGFSARSGRLRLAAGLLVSLALAAGGLPVAAQSGEPRSFTLSPLFPLTQGLVPYADPAPPRLGRGELLVSSAAVWTNSLRWDEGLQWPGYSLIVDGEGLVEKSSLGLGLGGGFYAQAYFEEAALFPGIMDPALSAFHHLFGFANQWRDYLLPNRLDIEVRTPSGLLFSRSASLLGPQSAGLGLGWNPGPGLPSLNLQIKLPLPAPEPWIFGGAPGFALSSAYSLSLPPWEGGLALGLAYQGTPDAAAAIATRTWLPQASARLFVDLGPGFALGAVAAAMLSPYAVEEWYLGGLVGNLWVGANWRLGPELELEAALIEELASWASVEVGFQTGLRWNLGGAGGRPDAAGTGLRQP